MAEQHNIRKTVIGKRHSRDGFGSMLFRLSCDCGWSTHGPIAYEDIALRVLEHKVDVLSNHTPEVEFRESLINKMDDPWMVKI